MHVHCSCARWMWVSYLFSPTQVVANPLQASRALSTAAPRTGARRALPPSLRLAPASARPRAAPATATPHLPAVGTGPAPLNHPLPAAPRPRRSPRVGETQAEASRVKRVPKQQNAVRSVPWSVTSLLDTWNIQFLPHPQNMAILLWPLPVNPGLCSRVAYPSTTPIPPIFHFIIINSNTTSSVQSSGSI